MSFVYGPVPSRRLGISLGVDVIPPFTCTFDCIYCQLGGTKNKVKDPRGLVFPKIDDIVKELKPHLEKSSDVDFITVSGSGEPTLNQELGKIASAIRSISDLPLTLITNSSLLSQPNVLRNAKKFDIVMPSLDAGDDKIFKLINRPAPGFRIDGIVDGIRKLRQETEGQVWLEVMLFKGRIGNIDHESIRDISAKISLIEPDMVFINTPVRPPCEQYVKPLTVKELMAAKNLMESVIECEVDIELIQEHTSSSTQMIEKSDVTGQIVRLLSVRPCTLQDMTGMTGLNPNEIAKHIKALLNRGLISKKLSGKNIYYHRSLTRGNET